MRVDHRRVMKVLVENNTHNPMTGTSLTMDWAQRNLGSGHISVGLLEPVFRQFGIPMPDKARSATEWDLIERAVNEAVYEANVKFSEIDCIIHVSPTASLPRTATRNIGFQDCLRDFHSHFGLRKDCRLYHLQNGCSGMGPPLFLARGLLESGSCKVVLLVTSVWGGPYRDVPSGVGRNDIAVWLCALLFGDAAAAAVLTSSPEVAKPRGSYFEVVRQTQFTNPNVWIAAINSDDAGDFITINPAAAKMLFVERFEYMLDEMGLRVGELDRVVIHQPNSDIVTRINETYKDVAKAPIIDIAHKYGNLVCSSALVNLYECQREEIPDGGSVFVFTLGADSGMTYSGTVLRHFAVAS